MVDSEKYQQLNIVGNRLDSARAALERSTSEWSKQYWTHTVNALLRQFKTIQNEISVMA